MVRVTIGDVFREDDGIKESWINQQINRRLVDGVQVCVKVEIEKPGIMMGLSTPTCIGTGRGGRRPNQREQMIFDLWEKFRLDTTEIRGGNLIAFLKKADIF